jgi:hypothetical protein
MFSKQRDANGFAKTFPQKLMELLSYDDVRKSITWMPKGDAFMIVKEKSFVEKVLPRFFKKTKFCSFKGKLYRWGFKRIMKGENEGAYFHKLFLRNNPTLCLHMRRIIRKVGGVSCATTTMEEINVIKAANQAPQFDFDEAKKPSPTVPKLPNPIFLPSSRSTCTNENYSYTLLLQAQLARKLRCEEMALRILMQNRFIGNVLGRSSIENCLESSNIHNYTPVYRQYYVDTLSGYDQMSGTISPEKNLSLPQLPYNLELSSSGDKKYLGALAGLLNLQNVPLS